MLAETSAQKNLDGARCTLKNNAGEWSVTAPGSVVVSRSSGPLVVRCIHGTLSGATVVRPTHDGSAYGRLFPRSAIGAGSAIARGVAYEYPASIVVRMDAGKPQ